MTYRQTNEQIKLGWTWLPTVPPGTLAVHGLEELFLSNTNILPKFVTLHNRKQFLCSFLHVDNSTNAKSTMIDRCTHAHTDIQTDKLTWRNRRIPG
jgi:hypothetical protein